MKTVNQFLNLTGTVLTRAAAVSLVVASFFFWSLACHGQGTLTITFDEPPSLDAGQGDGGVEYVESGVRFTPLFSGTVISHGVLRFRGPYHSFPDNGSTYFGGVDNRTNTLTFDRPDGASFNLLSVDLADYNAHFPAPGTVEFIGYRPDGSVVTTDFMLGPLIVDGRTAFETFYFGPGFANLERVEIPSHYWWMDNLVVSVPEPTTTAMIGLGLCMLVARFRKKNV